MTDVGFLSLSQVNFLDKDLNHWRTRLSHDWGEGVQIKKATVDSYGDLAL